MKVLAVVFPGFTLIDLTGPMQAFSFLEGFECQVAWKEPGPIPTHGGVSVNATHAFGATWKEPDILFVPGNGRALYERLQDRELLEFLADRGARAGWVTSVCNGSLLLGAAGLLKGYRAASYWYSRHLLARFDAIPDPARVVIDRNRATGGGMTAGIDFGLTMLGEIDGVDAGRMAELMFEYAPQAPYGCGRPDLAAPELVTAAEAILGHIMPVSLVPERPQLG
jgi:cyclohexyl-isocyanide hydratase